jgi:hypothetical protein
MFLLDRTAASVLPAILVTTTACAHEVVDRRAPPVTRIHVSLHVLTMPSVPSCPHIYRLDQY